MHSLKSIPGLRADKTPSANGDHNKSAVGSHRQEFDEWADVASTENARRRRMEIVDLLCSAVGGGSCELSLEALTTQELESLPAQAMQSWAHWMCSTEPPMTALVLPTVTALPAWVLCLHRLRSLVLSSCNSGTLDLRSLQMLESLRLHAVDSGSIVLFVTNGCTVHPPPQDFTSRLRCYRCDAEGNVTSAYLQPHLVTASDLMLNGKVKLAQGRRFESHRLVCRLISAAQMDRWARCAIAGSDSGQDGYFDSSDALKSAVSPELLRSDKKGRLESCILTNADRTYLISDNALAEFVDAQTRLMEEQGAVFHMGYVVTDNHALLLRIDLPSTADVSGYDIGMVSIFDPNRSNDAFVVPYVRQQGFGMQTWTELFDVGSMTSPLPYFEENSSLFGRESFVGVGMYHDPQRFLSDALRPSSGTAVSLEFMTQDEWHPAMVTFLVPYCGDSDAMGALLTYLRTRGPEVALDLVGRYRFLRDLNDRGFAGAVEAYMDMLLELHRAGKLSSQVVKSLLLEAESDQFGPYAQSIRSGSPACLTAMAHGLKALAESDALLPDDISEILRIQPETAQQAHAGCLARGDRATFEAHVAALGMLHAAGCLDLETVLALITIDGIGPLPSAAVDLYVASLLGLLDAGVPMQEQAAGLWAVALNARSLAKGLRQDDGVFSSNGLDYLVVQVAGIVRLRQTMEDRRLAVGENLRNSLVEAQQDFLLESGGAFDLALDAGDLEAIQSYLDLLKASVDDGTLTTDQARDLFPADRLQALRSFVGQGSASEWIEICAAPL